MTEPNKEDLQKDFDDAWRVVGQFTTNTKVASSVAHKLAELRAEADARVKQKEQDIYKKCKKITVDEVLNVPNDESDKFCVGWGCACRAILETIKKAADKAREE